MAKCYLLYINDLESRVPLQTYVDDSTFFEICYMSDVSVIQESIESAVNWTIRNDMTINSEKSKDMIINFTQYVNFRNAVPNIVIGGKPAEQADHAKLLGVTLSNDLTWKIHVDNIVRKSSKKGIYDVSVKTSRY